MVLRLIAATVIALSALPATGHAHERLTKHRARADAYAFVAPAIDLIDVNKTIAVTMTPARDCRRINHSTVACRFAFVVHGETVRARVVAHRQQRDGLIGIWMSVDPAAYWDD